MFRDNILTKTNFKCQCCSKKFTLWSPMVIDLDILDNCFICSNNSEDSDELTRLFDIDLRIKLNKGMMTDSDINYIYNKYY